MCVALVVLIAPPAPETRERVAVPAGDLASAAPLYDCRLVLRPSAALAADSAARLLLEDDGDGAAVRVTITRDALVIDALSAAGTRECAGAASRVTPGVPYAVTILRRGEWMGVLLGDDLLAEGSVPCAPGEEAAITADDGWEVVEMALAPREPVAFADNFMRAAEEPGAWKIAGGSWGLRSAWDDDPKGGGDKFNKRNFGQNLFAWVGRAEAGSPAACLTGEPFWDHYTFTASVHPPAGGAVGLLVNAADAAHGLLVRWTPTDDATPTGNRLALYRVDGGARTLLADAPGGYLPDGWYKLSVDATPRGITVAIDGRQRLAVEGTKPRRGGVGLYVEGADAALFDDITAYGHTLNTELIAERRLARFHERLAQDQAMSVWASARSDWHTLTTSPSTLMHRWDYFGDHHLALTVQPTGDAGELWLALNTDGRTLTAGCRAVIRTAPGDGALTYLLFDGARKLAEGRGAALAGGEEYGFRFARRGNRLRLERDGVMVAEAETTAPASGLRPGYRAEGGLAAVTDALVLGRNVLDDAFTEAPVDWIGHGTWMPTLRWACTPQWSFLGGWSHGEAALWHKQRFTGDQSFEVFVATKMEYPREREPYERRFRDYGLTLCGDGLDPRSGYAMIYGAPDRAGRPNRRTVLLRNGVEVASSPTACPGWGKGGHTQWYGLALHKRGATITASVNGDTVLRYTDRAPLEGGVPAVWTENNAIAVARARLHFARPPRPREEPRVALGEPWIPEWADLDRPLTLTFAQCWTTSGRPAALSAASRRVPPGNPPRYQVQGDRVRITPATVGDHWFMVTAADGAIASAPVHVALPVFNPALGRDDSRALVLYRFDEGEGSLVRDHGAISPRADLAIPAGSRVRWLPGQGLAFHGLNRLVAETHTEKLMSIARRNACTIEVWVSLDTIFPPTEWMGYLLAWEHPHNPRQNLALLHAREGLFFLANTTLMQPVGLSGAPASREMASAKEVRTGLQHFAVTWDGETTSCYLNGRLVNREAIPWNTRGWSADALLVLGSHLNPHPRRTREFARFYQVMDYVLEPLPHGPHGILGTYYLAAIHDRCLSPDDIRRHYQAGPSAR